MRVSSSEIFGDMGELSADMIAWQKAHEGWEKMGTQQEMKPTPEEEDWLPEDDEEDEQEAFSVRQVRAKKGACVRRDFKMGRK